MRTIWCLLFAIGCHHAELKERPPLPSPQTRINNTMRNWGYALRFNDDKNWERYDDPGGRFAVGYGAIKLLASEVPDGAEAVELTIFGMFWQALFNDKPESLGVVMPAGTLGPALVDAGLAKPSADERFALVALPWQETVGKMDERSKQYRRELFEKQAWSCRPTKLERTVLPTDATLQRAALVSSHIVGWWLEDLDAIWVVRAMCTTGPALFIITGYVDQKTGYTNDKVLLAKL